MGVKPKPHLGYVVYGALRGDARAWHDNQSFYLFIFIIYFFIWFIFYLFCLFLLVYLFIYLFIYLLILFINFIYLFKDLF